jgi:ATP synthase protein I
MAQDDSPQRSGASHDDARAQFSAMLRGALVPTVVVGVLAVVVALVSGGSRSATSAGLGALLVLLFFSTSLLVMRQSSHLPPTTVMAVVLAAYTGKILALGLAMVLLRDASWIAGRSLAFTVIACTVVWLGFEMRAFTRMRFLVAPGADA